MIHSLITTLTLAASFTSAVSGQYNLVQDYSGANFFDGWWAFTGADPTQGFVNYVDLETAGLQKLAGFIYNRTTMSTSAYIGADYTHIAPNGRSSVRLTTNATFSNGALIVADVLHTPLTGACGSWPAFWALGPNWPNNGEIDIIEGINMNQYNEMALHTLSGCNTSNASSTFLGSLQAADCDATANSNTGCAIFAPPTVTLDDGYGETNQLATAGTAFNEQGGGVYVTLWDESGIKVYLFPHEYLPTDISSGKPDPSSWTVKPLASFSGPSCDFLSSFQQLSLVIDQTFCGSWAGAMWNQSSCAGKAATCEEFVANNPSAFKDAYWNFASIKVYQKPSPLANHSEIYSTLGVSNVEDGSNCSAEDSLTTAIGNDGNAGSSQVPCQQPGGSGSGDLELDGEVDGYNITINQNATGIPYREGGTSWSHKARSVQADNVQTGVGTSFEVTSAAAWALAAVIAFSVAAVL